MTLSLTTNVHPSFQPMLTECLQTLAPAYLQELSRNMDYLPVPQNVFNAFSQPLANVNYILFGESPYPRDISANGYAFWDNAVTNLWSATGLAKTVNRATSLRNFIKMLLVAADLLPANDCSQAAIAKIDKQPLITTISELFHNMIAQGFLLLNASLIYRENKVVQDAKAWLPFMDQLLQQLYAINPNVKLILFGKIAEKIENLPAAKPFQKLCAEHPYNVSFIYNQSVQAFFKPLALLR